jgi:putative phosphoesterase
MRLAIISDIHGNLEALQHVLDRVHKEGAESLVCLGDIVGYGPFPNECVDLVRQSCSIVIRGNHDAGAVGTLSSTEFNKEGRLAIEWTRTHLIPENREFLKNLPVSVASDTVTFVHASPREPERWDYIATWKHFAEAFDHFNTTVCCIGHTHVPAIVSPDGKVNGYQKGKRHLINCGSVGQPRDGDPRASFALLDTELDVASIIRVPYNVEATAKAIIEAGLPEFLARRLSFGI